MTKLYFRTTDDEYRLPIGVCRFTDVKKVHGINNTSVSHCVRHCKNWEMVEIEEDDDGKKD